MRREAPDCQEKLFRFIYKLYIINIKLHYIVFYCLPRPYIVDKKLKKTFKTDAVGIETRFGAPAARIPSCQGAAGLPPVGAKRRSCLAVRQGASLASDLRPIRTQFRASGNILPIKIKVYLDFGGEIQYENII